MSWFERIHVRAFSKHTHSIAQSIIREVRPLIERRCDGEVKILLNPDVENDLLVILEWNGDLPPENESALGRELSAMFAEHGSCHTTSWIKI